MGRILISIIRLYQRFLSPLLGENCRFSPSCSQYAIDAVRVHGGIVGAGYTLWRIARCQPFCRGGYDPVPPNAALAAAGVEGGVRRHWRERRPSNSRRH